MLLAAPAFARSLHWNAIDVDARLDRDGNLHVVERQEMVFDGDWNGGERDFNLRPGQDVEIHRITRITDDGRTIALTEGSTDAVDRWDWVSDDLVRWRSRLPSDPPFANQSITYVLDYTYRNILVPAGENQFRFDHDFGLPQRSGAVKRFRLRVVADPVWGVQPVAIDRVDLQPGEGVTVDGPLTYRGEWPAGVEKPLSPLVPVVALLLFLATALALIVRFVKSERATGRFEPVRAQFDPELLKLDPEVAGAVWDGGIGAPEVAAVLARMAQEKKITTRAEGRTLRMTLDVPRNRLDGYERDLVSKLFFDGGNETDTDRVKTHYARTGFDPSKVIRDGIELKLEEIAHWTKKVRRFNWKFDALLLVVAVLLLAGSGFAGDTDVGAAAIGFFATGLFGMFAALAASHFSKAIDNLALAFAVPMALLAVASLPFLVCTALATVFGLHAPALFALLLWTLALMNLTLDLLKIRDTPAKIAYRKRIAGTRRYFIEQLQLRDPHLKDEWFPYVLAFGLGDHVDRWFSAFGGASRDTSMSSFGSSSSSPASASSSSWTGGGGAFGGAGASGSWAIAAGAMAAGVSAPSSSSGGGGGSSSGGGGGGGW